MIHYSLQPRDRIFIKGYGFFNILEPAYCLIINNTTRSLNIVGE